MHPVVVDPGVLLRAFKYPRTEPAQLLALFAYGRVCAIASGGPLDELDLAERQGRRVDLGQRERAELLVEEARQRKQRMEKDLEQHSPSDLLLVTSARLLMELRELAQQAQLAGELNVLPDVVYRLTVVHTVLTVGDLLPTTSYLGARLDYHREYLIHTAIESGAPSLITDDAALELPGDASFVDERTKRRVQPFSFHEFVLMELPANFNLAEIDAPKVLRTAIQP